MVLTGSDKIVEEIPRSSCPAPVRVVNETPQSPLLFGREPARLKKSCNTLDVRGVYISEGDAYDSSSARKKWHVPAGA